MARINYDSLSEINCEYCGVLIKPTGPSQKSCVSCRRHCINLDAQVNRDVARFNKFGTYETVGKGGNNKKGVDNKQYINGIGFFHNVLSPAVKTRRFCESCGVDLINANRYEWCAHHIDHNRSNNVIDNMMLLCKRCHQIEHDCANNLPK